MIKILKMQKSAKAIQKMFRGYIARKTVSNIIYVSRVYCYTICVKSTNILYIIFILKIL